MGLWSMVYGLWSMVYGLWSMVYGLWSMVYGLWSMVSFSFLISLNQCQSHNRSHKSADHLQPEFADYRLSLQALLTLNRERPRA
jgi:uncharacterized membrane protein